MDTDEISVGVQMCECEWLCACESAMNGCVVLIRDELAPQARWCVA